MIYMSVIIVATRRYGLARFLGSRPMVLGGVYSHSIYMLHPFLIRLAVIGKPDTPSLPEFLVRLVLFVATAVAFVTYVLIEAPARA